MGISIALPFLPWQHQLQHIVASCTTSATNETIVFHDKFDRHGVIKEARSMSNSSDQNWWVSSGGYLYLNNGTASTIQGKLAKNDTIRIAYSDKGDDTDKGYRPQNIFRMVNRNNWSGNYTEELYFKYSAYNNKTAHGKNLGAENGVSLMVNYKDEDNLYYVGLRADGLAGIKKKIDGNYSALQNPVKVFPGVYKPNDTLIPQDKWIGLRAVVEHRQSLLLGKDQIYIAMYIDEKGDGSSWKYVTSFLDERKIFKQGHTGIRTDFIDAQFRDFQVNPRDSTVVCMHMT